MKNDHFEQRMRKFENTNDYRLYPDMFTIARIDGRNFSRLTRSDLKLKPFDETIRNCMIETVKHLMDNTGFKCVFGFTQSDEISILFDSRYQVINNTFAGKIRKFNSILASEASVKFSMLMNHHSVFDCRIIQLPTMELVQDYFLWRISDSERNCLNQWCYYLLINNDGLSALRAQKTLDKQTIQWKNEYLFNNHGINFDKLPSWHKRGVGIYFMDYEKDGYNPITKQTVQVIRRKLNVNLELPRQNYKYSKLIAKLYDNIIITSKIKEKNNNKKKETN